MPSPTSQDLARLRIDRAPERTRSPRKKRGLPGLGLVLAAGLLGAAGWLFWPRLAPYLARARAPTVTTAFVVVTQPGAELVSTTAAGYVVARTHAALAARQAGRLVELHVEEGSIVKKDDLIARVDPTRWKHEEARLVAALAKAEAEIESARLQVTLAEKSVAKMGPEIEEAESAVMELDAQLKEADRVLELEQGLASRGSGTRDTLEKATNEKARLSAVRNVRSSRVRILQQEKEWREVQIEAARAQIVVDEGAAREAAARLAAARTDVDDTKITAPFSGVVIRKEAELGEMVVPALAGGGTSRGSVVTLVDFESLEIEVDVFERDIGSIQEQGPAEVTLEAWPSRALPGRVRRIVPSADRAKGTVMVKVAFDRGDLNALPDMRGRVAFLSKERERDLPPPEVLCPKAAVANRKGSPGVFLLEADRVRFQPLEFGPERGNHLVTLRGLSGGERVVVYPAPELDDRMLVITKENDD